MRQAGEIHGDLIADLCFDMFSAKRFWHDLTVQHCRILPVSFVIAITVADQKNLDPGQRHGLGLNLAVLPDRIGSSAGLLPLFCSNPVTNSQAIVNVVACNPGRKSARRNEKVIGGFCCWLHLNQFGNLLF